MEIGDNMVLVKRFSIACRSTSACSLGITFHGRSKTFWGMYKIHRTVFFFSFTNLVRDATQKQPWHEVFALDKGSLPLRRNLTPASWESGFIFVCGAKGMQNFPFEF